MTLTSLYPPKARLPPLPDQPTPFPTEPPLDAPLIDLVAWWLSVLCACRTHSYLPFRWLAAAHGWQTLLSAVLPRLKCSKCGERPARIEIVDDAAVKPGATRRVLRIV